MTPPTGGGANRGDVWVEGDFGFVICDFILFDGYISGVCGPRVEPGAKRDGGPGGARAVFFGFDYGENGWVYVDVWRFRDGTPNAAL